MSIKIPHWLEEIIGAGALDIGVGGLALPLLISILKKSMAQKTTPMPTPTGEVRETAKEEELKLKTAFMKAMTELGILKGYEDCPEKINKFLNTRLPHGWQRKNFRTEVGRLANITYEKVGDVLEKKDWTKTTPRENATPIIEETHEEKRLKLTGNLGVDFLKGFGQLTEDRMYAVCDSSGLLHSELHSELKSIDKGLKKAKKWFDKNGQDTVKGIKNLRKTIGGGKKVVKSQHPIKDHFREAFWYLNFLGNIDFSKLTESFPKFHLPKFKNPFTRKGVTP